MTPALLPLLVAVPVLAAAFAALCPWPAGRRVLAHAVVLASTAAGLALLLATRDGSIGSVQVGGFVPGVAIPFVVDAFSALLLVATGVVTAAALWFCDLTGEFTRSRWFAPLALLLLAGVNGALITGDLFNLFVFVEVMLMPSYALLAMTGGWRRIGTGRLFVVVNLLTSTLLLVGVGLVYAVAGTVNIAALAGAAHDDGRLAAAIGTVLVALCIKAGSFPVHGWLPRSYPATSAGVMALFAGLHTKVALYAVLRIWAVIGGLDPAWSWLLLASALVSTLAGALGSLRPLLVREVWAWQMVSGVGVILTALAVGTGGATDGPASAAATAGLVGAIVYMLHHMVTMASLITATGAAERTYGTGRLDRLSDLWHRDRWLGVVMVLGAAALLGLPLTSGLVAKLEVIGAALTTGGPAGIASAAVVLISSLIGLVAVMRVWRDMMWGRPMQASFVDPATRVPARLVAPAAALAAVSVAMFLGYGAVASVVDSAVGGLVDTGPYREAVLPVAPPGGPR